MIIIANIIGLIASIIMVYIGIIKNKKKIIFIELIDMFLLTISNIMLGGITAAIINILSIIRNALCYKDHLFLKEKIILTILSIILSIKFNNLGIIGYLPLISNITYIWTMNTKNIIKFKYIIIFTMLLWSIHDLAIKSYSIFIFDILTIITNIIGIIRVKKGAKYE